MSSPTEPGAQGWMPDSSGGPMTVGRILDRIWAILRGNAGLFLRLGAVPAAAMVAVYGILFGVLAAEGMFQVPHPSQPPDPLHLLWGVVPAMLLALVPLVVAYAVYQAAACHAAISANRGGGVTFGDAYRAVGRNAGRYVGLMLLQALCVALPVVVILAALTGAFAVEQLEWKGGISPGALFLVVPLVMVLYLLAMVYAVWMALRLGLAFPACVAESLGPLEALRRSSALTRSAKGRMFVVLLVVFAISYAAFLVFELAMVAMAAILALLASGMHLNLSHALGTAGIMAVAVAIALLYLVWMALIWAGYAISLSVLYEDQLVRIDGSGGAAITHGEPA